MDFNSYKWGPRWGGRPAEDLGFREVKGIAFCFFSFFGVGAWSNGVFFGFAWFCFGLCILSGLDSVCMSI